MKKNIKKQAIYLRYKGFSLSEISEQLGVAKSTASIWLRSIKLDKKAKNRIDSRMLQGRKKAVLTIKMKQKELLNFLNENNEIDISNIEINRSYSKMICALLYWCEGEKSGSAVRFVNSDPKMVKTFLFSLRNAYSLDETKFRACLHLHSYHNETKQKKFWIRITKISENLFLKTYQKSNTGKQKKEGYLGCISIRYYDHKIMKDICSYWNLFSEKYGRVV